MAWAKVGGASVTIVSFLIWGAITKAEVTAMIANAFMVTFFMRGRFHASERITF